MANKYRLPSTLGPKAKKAVLRSKHAQTYIAEVRTGTAIELLAAQLHKLGAAADPVPGNTHLLSITAGPEVLLEVSAMPEVIYIELGRTYQP